MDMSKFSAPGSMDIAFSPIRAMQDIIAKIEQSGQNVVRLTQGLPSFDTPAHIKAACIEAIKQGKTQYGENLGLLPLRQAISDKLSEDNGLDYDPRSEIMITHGVSQGIALALTAFLAPDDEVLLCAPVFPPYVNGVKLCNARVVTVPTYSKHQYLPQIADIQACVSAKTKLLVLINPVNPKGAVFPLSLLEQIAQLAVAEDLLVIADEIYEKIIFDDATHHSIAKLPFMRERTILLNGFSKSHAMTGWRLGYIATDANLMQTLLKVQQNTDVCANTFVQYGGLAALSGPQQSCQQMLEQLQIRRDLLCNGLQQFERFEFVKPQGALYLYANIENFGMSAYQLCDMLLHKFHIAIVPWNDKCVRLSFVADCNKLQQGLLKIGHFNEQV